jgi:hypothetical protein
MRLINPKLELKSHRRNRLAILKLDFSSIDKKGMRLNGRPTLSVDSQVEHAMLSYGFISRQTRTAQHL